MRLLVIEDDSRISANLSHMLTSVSYAVDLANTGNLGLSKAQSENYDLLIIDWMLPDLSGPQLIKILRSQGSSVPILMLTAKTQLDDIVEGLNSGADDYLPKPFHMAEFLARVRTLLRRTPVTINSTIQIADLTINSNLRQVTRAGKEISLSPREYALLEYLARHPNQSFDRVELLTHVWDENTDEFSNTVDVHIRYLRRKIDDPYPVKLIHTVKGKGYALLEP